MASINVVGGCCGWLHGFDHLGFCHGSGMAALCESMHRVPASKACFAGLKMVVDFCLDTNEE